MINYLQTLNGISAENNSTIVFPVPIDIMSSFLQVIVNLQSISFPSSISDSGPEQSHTPPAASPDQHAGQSQGGIHSIVLCYLID